MKKLSLLAFLFVVAAGCGGPKGSGELIGVQGREEWFQPDPFGTLWIPMGSYNMGPADEDAPFAHNTKSKTVSIQAFYIDQTEITNNEYRQFVDWVTDSIAHSTLIAAGLEEGIVEDAYGQAIDPAQINWELKIDRETQEIREGLEAMYLPAQERFYGRREIDTRKLNYLYYWIDYRTAARKANRFIPEKEVDPKNGREYINGKGSYTVNGKTGLDRSVFIIKEVVNVYPDTLAWIHDFTYSFNEPLTNMYYWHPAYDDYPVVGVTWKQAKAFCVWRTNLLNDFFMKNGGVMVQDFRLPTESEWEYAARGGLALSPYPWGGPYIRNARGCFLGNFKPMRGSYIDDGGLHTVKAYSYNPNDYGLYCMAGNASEWTSNAFDESAYDFSHDLNPDYLYDAQDNDPTVLKRKVIRGGSWKDVGYFLQTSARSFEYQDTAKCYIGFRCVMSYLGRAKDDRL